MIKEYIKLFNDLQSANGYFIKDIPFIATASGETPQNVHCNRENKKIKVTGDTMEVVDDAPLNTIFRLSDGSSVQLSGSTITSANTNSYKSTLVGVEIGRRVTGIGYQAFSACTQLTSVTISDSVESIDRYAFYGCTSLPVDENGLRYADTFLIEATDKTKTSFEIKEKTKWIGIASFSGCSSMTGVSIPNSVKAIGNDVFAGCSNLVNITIPSSVTSMGSGVFSNCTSLTSISIPDGVTSLGGYMFSGCTQLSSVTLSNNINSVGYSPFSGCTSLPSISGIVYADWYLVRVPDKSLSSYTIQPNTKAIETGAFNGCSGVTCITIPNGVFTMGDYSNGSFSGVPFICYSGKARFSPWGAGHVGVLIEGDILYGDFEKTNIVGYLNKNASSAVIPSGVTSIGTGAFSGLTSLTSVTIGSDVTYIGNDAFRGCSNLSEISMPAGVQIGERAFNNCTSLPQEDGVVYAGTCVVGAIDKSKTTYTLRSGTTWIGSGAFLNCQNLTGMTIPESVIGIGDSAFAYNYNLKSINIPSGVTYFGAGILKDCTGFTDIQDNLRYADTYLVGVVNTGQTFGAIRNGTRIIGANAFASNTKLTSPPLIPDTVELIDDYAFDNPRFKSIVIPDSVKVIGNLAFNGKANKYYLTAVTFGNGLIKIGSSAFSYNKISNITLPDSLKIIGGSAFDHSVATNLRLGSGIRSIGRYAFWYCSTKNLVIPDTADDIHYQAFASCSSMGYMVYNGASVEAPFGATCTICKAIENEVAYIDKEKTELAKCFNTSISSVTIPDTVKTIRNSAFGGCSSLSPVYVPSGVTSIGSSAFSGVSYVCYSGSSTGSPWGAKHGGVLIENNFLYYDTSKTIISAYISKTATAITIPSLVKSIMTNAFSGCTGITYIEIPSGVTAVGSGALRNCSNLTSVTISDSISAISSNMFYSCSGLTSIAIPSNIKTIGSYAFSYCYSLSSITIPNSVNTIENCAFSGCTSLNSITIPDSVTSIGDGVFAGCRGAVSVSLGSGITGVSNNLFKYCGGITSVVIPDYITSIGNYAFGGCWSLSSVTIGSGVTNIGQSAFESCFEIKNITIPSGVTTIGASAFSGIENVVYEGSATGAPWGAKYINAYVDGDFIYTSSAKTTLQGCNPSVTGEITIPSTVTTINDNTFSSCSNVTSVIIPNSVTSIGSDAFYYGEVWSYESPCPITSFTCNNVTYPVNGEQNITITLANGSDVTLNLWYYYCFLPGTQITLADGTTKAVEDIIYNDELKVWNFDEGCYDTAYPIWISRPGRLEKYYVITLEDGTVLKVAGANSGHKIYNVDEHKFEGCVTIKVGTHVYTENGIKEIVSKETIEENVTYYNLMTDRHINCFAESVLTSMRYNSIYPFSEDMKFIKDGRTPRPYSEFETVGISKYWYDGLRLAEQTDTLERISAYIKRLENKMLPKE